MSAVNGAGVNGVEVRGTEVNGARAVVGALLVLLSGCGGVETLAGTGQPLAQPLTAPTAGIDADELVPPGYGTLTQAQFTLYLQSGELEIQVTPLVESVIRLAAPDTYQRLVGLATSARESLRSRIRDETPLFLVSLFSRAQNTPYEPENLHLVNGGLRSRPTAIEAITPGWGGPRLRQQETQMAVYAFGGIDLNIALMVEYEGVSDTAWDDILQQLQLERARVRARVGSAPIGG